MRHKSFFKTAALQHILFGTPTTEEFSYENIILALEAENDVNPAINIGVLLEHKETIEFVCEWFLGSTRKGGLGSPRIQHYLTSACIAAIEYQSTSIVLACLLKGVAQRQPSQNEDLGNKEYLDHRRILKMPELNTLLDSLEGLSDFALGYDMGDTKKKKTWVLRAEEKYRYLWDLKPEALYVELMSKYENLAYDLTDFKQTGNVHWTYFDGKAGEEIRYFKTCLNIFKTIPEKMNCSKILSEFQEMVDGILETNRKPVKVAEVAE